MEIQYTGTICWSGQIIPQIWKSYREKNTAGLSPWMMFVFCHFCLESSGQRIFIG